MADDAAPAAKHWLPPEPSPVDLASQIAEIKRELALRENVYPGFVVRSRLTSAEADQHYNRLRSALRTLMWVQRHQAALRNVNLDPDKVEPT